MLGKLKKIDLRNVWKHEAFDFTNWLSLDENLTLLGDEIGVEINLIQTEAESGDFNVDILAQEENTGNKIIIENQLEITNHDHLGKIITYAAAHDAKMIIWVVKEAREEHRRSIDWLNEHADEETNFFIIKIELWQIGNSEYAPKFQIISKPNEWAKTVKRLGDKPRDLTETKIMQLDFWNKFKEYALESNTTLRLRKTNPQHWYNISYGSSKSHIALSINTQLDRIGCEIYINDSKELFDKFYGYKDNIESELNQQLDWMRLPEKKASRILLLRDANLQETEEWEEYFQWLQRTAENFQEVFSKFLKKAKR